jgi:hypothetical protein
MGAAFSGKTLSVLRDVFRRSVPILIAIIDNIMMTMTKGNTTRQTGIKGAYTSVDVVWTYPATKHNPKMWKKGSLSLRFV